jgi:hypothetical protein
MKKKNLTCDICGKTFKNTTGAKLHFQRIHSTIARIKKKDPTLVTASCFCGATFFSEKELSDHAKTFHPAPPTPQEIAAKRTEKDWLDCIDNALVNSGIVPCATSEKPHGMDRLEAIEHLIKLVKEGQKPAPPENTFQPPWEVRIVTEFEGACRAAVNMLVDDPSKDHWNSTVEKTLSKKRNDLIRIIGILHRKAAFADEYERELLS